MSFRPAAILFAVAVLLASCASTPEVGFSKVKIYRLDPDKRPDMADPALAFEYKHHMYGAVTATDRDARRGNYYTFFWNTPDLTRPVTVKFEYRQSQTGFAVHTLESVTTELKGGTNTTRFEVAGEDYKRRGKLLGWKATLIQGGKVISVKKSYLWD